MVFSQFDSGFHFLRTNFQNEMDSIPRVAFSIDGFGHSSLTPYILNALNFEALVISRIPVEVDK
jgi:hypothetical protein